MLTAECWPLSALERHSDAASAAEESRPAKNKTPNLALD
jgi:hypothetical protein